MVKSGPGPVAVSAVTAAGLGCSRSSVLSVSASRSDAASPPTPDWLAEPGPLANYMSICIKGLRHKAQDTSPVQPAKRYLLCL